MNLLVLYLMRVVNGFLIKYSYFYPDEYYQSVEIAHNDYYGSGFRSWEWTLQQPIRSPLYPFIFSIYYHILD